MTQASPFTQAVIERAIKAVLKTGLPVTGVTVRPDGSYTVNTVEDRADPKLLNLTPLPKLVDAREKFRGG